MDEWARAEIEALKQRVAALEGQLSPLKATAAAPAAAAPQVPAAPPQADPELVELVRRGKALEAIHSYVNKTGADLATAKAEVARIAASLSPTDFVS